MLHHCRQGVCIADPKKQLGSNGKSTVGVVSLNCHLFIIIRDKVVPPRCFICVCMCI